MQFLLTTFIRDMVLHMHTLLLVQRSYIYFCTTSGTNNIQVIQLNGVNTLNTVADGAITTAKIIDGCKCYKSRLFDPEDDATALAIALG